MKFYILLSFSSKKKTNRIYDMANWGANKAKSVCVIGGLEIERVGGKDDGLDLGGKVNISL